MIWLVGSKGMLGTDLADELTRLGLPFLGTNAEVDIADSHRVAAEAASHPEVEWIVNCAGYTAVDQAEDDREACFRVNSEGPEVLAAAAASLHAALLHISTDYVFDGALERPYTEEDAPRPAGVYARSKWEGERRVAASLDRHVILRTSWLYGVHGRSFVRTMLRLFRERNQVSVVADQWGSPTYTRDLAGAICSVLTRRHPRFGTFHYSGEGRTNWYEFARRIYEAACRRGLVGRPVEIRPIATFEYPAKAPRPANSYLSKARFVETFGLPVRRWESALEAFMEECAACEASSGS